MYLNYNFLSILILGITFLTNYKPIINYFKLGIVPGNKAIILIVLGMLFGFIAYVTGIILKRINRLNEDIFTYQLINNKIVK